jgi:hypothetical protein
VDRKGNVLLEGGEKGVVWREESIQFMSNINQKYLPEIRSLV